LDATLDLESDVYVVAKADDYVDEGQFIHSLMLGRRLTYLTMEGSFFFPPASFPPEGATQDYDEIASNLSEVLDLTSHQTGWLLYFVTTVDVSTSFQLCQVSYTKQRWRIWSSKGRGLN
jgi:hypothetical protein